MVYLAQPLESLLESYGNSFDIHGLDAGAGLLVLAAGGVLGLLGAGLSVQRYLRQFRLASAGRSR